ncbi:copper chaperone PCu(A)C [uncultured Sneathiella sp.]|uniref:copper chaperone PCu(A)C n=1 Tax=uncultured Sneathiella sp. TaxID=879315 RepID=UPI0030EE59DF|tara:strand:- start:27119 stop:27586 length:468 start_codon:yes stop_codon:yes gene_type:complete
MSKALYSFFLAFFFLASAFPAFAEPTQLGDLIIETPWARASIGMSRPAAAYVTIRNEGQTTDILTGIETTVSAMPEVHRMEMKNGVASMGPAGPVEIPANGSVKLAPGGLHVMLMKLQQPLRKGDQFSMTLIFKDAGRVDISVPIYSVGASGPEE